MVFYLKYRPQKVSELDSQAVREKLESVLSSKRPIPHAFLFTGPKGLGKTSTARILAKVINCTNRKPGETEPCNRCISCKSTTEGSNLDVLEIDAASNRGIDEIRDLREKIRLSPVSSKKKIYIIDEVHMLTTEAFNALLKTLEEPPDHAVFILCTTESHKVPKTILSRCFQISFPQASNEEIVRSLKRISKGEDLKVEEDALFSIASLSDGSFRDASKIIEEITRSQGNRKITKEIVEENYKISSLDKSVSDLALYLSKKDLGQAISLINLLEESGVDAKFFTQELISYLHKALILKLGIIDGKDSGINLSINEIKELFELISESSNKIRYSIFPFLPLEIVIIDWCQKNVSFQEVSETQEEVVVSKTPKHDNMLTEELIEIVKKSNYSIAGVLRACSLKVSNGKAVIETPYKFHKDRLDEAKTKKLLEDSLKEMTGKKLNLEIQLKK